MAEINSETIVSAVLKVLQKKFTTARRYRDTQNQNIIKPCFFVEQLIAPFEKQMGNRLRRSYRIKITYLSDGTHESLSKHLRQVGDKLLEALSFLSLTETEGVFGRSAEYEIAAAGAVLADVWVDGVTMPVIDGLGDEFLDYVKDGMKITVKADGTVEVE